MNRNFTKFRHELGKACAVGFVTVIVSLFVTSYFSTKEISIGDYASMSITGLLLLIASATLLSETKTLAKGKWKSMKVKKDTTIHYQVEENE